VFGDLVIIGERAWDAMRGLDYLLSLRDSESQEDPNQIAIVGLSLGGWIIAYAGSLEPRFALTIPGCCLQDVMRNSQVGGSHCLRWLNADINEYIDTSDIYPLIAARPMIIKTGEKDNTHTPPTIRLFEETSRLQEEVALPTMKSLKTFHYIHYAMTVFNTLFQPLLVYLPQTLLPIFLQVVPKFVAHWLL